MKPKYHKIGWPIAALSMAAFSVAYGLSVERNTSNARMVGQDASQFSAAQSAQETDSVASPHKHVTDPTVSAAVENAPKNTDASLDTQGEARPDAMEAHYVHNPEYGQICHGQRTYLDQKSGQVQTMEVCHLAERERSDFDNTDLFDNATLQSIVDSNSDMAAEAALFLGMRLMVSDPKRGQDLTLLSSTLSGKAGPIDRLIKNHYLDASRSSKKTAFSLGVIANEMGLPGYDRFVAHLERRLRSDYALDVQEVALLRSEALAKLQRMNQESIRLRGTELLTTGGAS